MTLIRVSIRLVTLLVLLSLGACESANEQFCARYQYVFNQLLNEKNLPSYNEMHQQLLLNMQNPNKKKEQQQFMLFVLEDWHNGIKPEGEEPREFCMRAQRWKSYHYSSG